MGAPGWMADPGKVSEDEAYRLATDGLRRMLAEFRSQGFFPDFDLATVPDATSWTAQHDIASLTPTTNGLVIAISGGDPYMAGPARDYPAGKLLWLHVRLKSDQSGTAQVFYYQSGPTEADSVRFYVAGGDWQEVMVPMPALGAGWRLRFDPPGTTGSCVVAWMRVEETGAGGPSPPGRACDGRKTLENSGRCATPWPCHRL